MDQCVSELPTWSPILPCALLLGKRGQCIWEMSLSRVSCVNGYYWLVYHVHIVLSEIVLKHQQSHSVSHVQCVYLVLFTVLHRVLPFVVEDHVSGCLGKAETVSQDAGW